MKNTYFLCLLFKMTDIKNENIFFMMVRIISRHYKKIIGVIINYFSTSDTFNDNLGNILLPNNVIIIKNHGE
jgi:hypothetical protein